MTTKLSKNELSKQLGIDEKEAGVYLAMLVLGECTISALTKKLGLPRSNVYLFISRLNEKGLVSQVTRGKKNYYASASPERLRSIAIENEKKAKENRENVEKILPDLSLLANCKERPKIQYFSGKEGVKAIFEDLISSGEIKNYYIGSLEKVSDVVGERYLKDWMHRRVKAGIFSYGVRIKSEELPARTYRSSRKMMREIRYAPENFNSPFYIVIYGNRVAMVSNKQERFGLIIESRDLAQTQKSLFEVLWQASK